MAQHTTDPRDPTLAAVLSAAVPGLGLVYAGRGRAGMAILALEVVAYAVGWWLLLLLVHAWQITVAGGEASVCAARSENVIARARALAAAQANAGSGPA